MLNGFADSNLSSLEDFAEGDAEYGNEYYGGKDVKDYLDCAGGIGTLFDCGYLGALAEGPWPRWEHCIFGDLDADSA